MFKKPLLSKLSIIKIVKKFKLELLVIFGSHANGSNTTASDIDIGFYAQERLNQYQLVDLYIDLSKATGKKELSVIDMYFDKPGDKGTYYRELKLIHHSIFQNSKTLYEKKFRFYKNLIQKAKEIEDISPEKLKQLIFKDKIAKINELIEQTKTTEKDLKTHYSIQASEAFRKLNRFVINNFTKTKLQDDYVNGITLSNLLRLDPHSSKRLSESAFLQHLVHADYVVGPSTIISWFTQTIENDYPIYLEKLTEHINKLCPPQQKN